jgi:hypothetical protein
VQEKIAKGSGCEKKRLGEPCQKGCHGFSFLLDGVFPEISGDIKTWIDSEIISVKKN